MNNKLMDIRPQWDQLNTALMAKKEKYASLVTKEANLQQEYGDSISYLPMDLQDKYHDWTTRRLAKKLEAVNKEVKKLGGVNTAVLVNYEKMTEDRDNIKRNYNNIAQELESGWEAKDALEDKSMEEVAATFTQIKSHFETLFSEIVPQGCGRMRLVNKGSGDNDAENILAASGVELLVDFNGRGHMKNMKSLSGGQKAVVGLVFILALQKCHEYPFFLFDEVDAALDADHRESVIKLLKKNQSQFILTTFRPEFVHYAEALFRVHLFNSNSHVEQVNIQEALQFVQG